MNNENSAQSESGYCWDPKDYSSHSTAQFAWALELMEKLRLRGNERVLDLGCGDGKVSLEIAKKLHQGSILGIDSSREMIEYARTRYPRSEWTNLGFEVRDALNLNFHQEFDIVFSNAVLHWIKDHEKVLHEVAKSLRKPGRVLFQMGGRGNAREISRIVDTTIETDGWKKFFSGFSSPYNFCGPDEYNDWLVSAGLSPTRVELIPRDMTQQGREGLASWIRTTWLAYTQRLPAELRSAFVDEVVDTYTGRFPPDDEGLVHVEMVRLEVEAVK